VVVFQPGHAVVNGAVSVARRSARPRGDQEWNSYC
jgi:hypothetical protein